MMSNFFVSTNDNNLKLANFLIDQGDIYWSSGDLENALKNYCKAIEMEPKNSIFYHKIGDFFLETGSISKAIDAYNKALELDPQSKWSYYNLGIAFYKTGEWQQSFESHQKLTELDSEFWTLNAVDFQVQYKLGDFLFEQNAIEAAVVCYRRAIALNGNFHWSFTNLARSLYQLGQIDEAIIAAHQGIEIKSDFDWGYFYLGEILSNVGRSNEAITAYHRALELNSDLPEIYQRLENLHRPQGEDLLDQEEHLLETTEESLSVTPEESPPPEPVPEPDEDRLSLNEPAQVKAIYITEHTLLLDIQTDLEINHNAQIQWDGCNNSKICFLEQVKSEPINQYLLAVDHHPTEKQNTLDFFTISSHEDLLLVEAIHVHPSGQLLDFFKPISTEWSQKQFFDVLIQVLENLVFPPISELCQLMGQLRDGLEDAAKMKLEYGCWLSPSIVYLEASVQNRWIFGQAKALILSNQGCTIARGHLFQISHNQLAGIIVANQDIYTLPYEIYTVVIIDSEAPVKIEGGIFEKAYSLEFVQRLNGKPEYQKHLIRESLSWGLIELIPKHLQPEAGNLLYKLQSFIQVPPIALIDPNLPFNIFIDQAIPIQSEGLFLYGWMHDPYNSLEEIEVVSALGFSMLLDKDKIYRLERQDVSEYIQTTRYAHFESRLGFCAYVQVPEAVRQKFEDFADLHSFRFKIKLKGGVELEIIPDTKYHDVFSARQTVVKIAPAHKVSDDMLENCIGPAAGGLQKLCIAQVKAKEVKTIGKPVQNPKVSIIIPLYKQLDFIKVQFTTLAHDPFTKDCEIIYILDSPEQETEVKNILIEYSALFQTPVKLVIINRNSGYAAANNVGVQYAAGQYLVLMNSDVFPKTIGWSKKMVAFYESSPQIGAIAPKLIYEDESLQHAGMFFEKTTFPFWITLHSYKGFSNHYPAAQINRQVPAVTGACLMIKKDLYEQVGGYTTDYVIGDFEDSDLCLKCRELGYESWYFADAELYHLERQSVPQSPVYSGSVVWRYNAHLHQQRWGDEIEKMMQTFTNF